DLGLDVGAAAGAGGGPAPAAAVEQAAEEVAQVEAGRGVAEVGALEASALAGPERAAEAVVLLAPVRIGERVVRLPDRLEALLGRRVARVRVRVVLAGQLAVGLLDLVGARALGDAERLVVVGHPLLLALRRGAARDDDARGAHDPVAQAVAALPDGRDRALGMLRGLVAEGLVDVRVERLARLRLDLLEAAPVEDVGQLLAHPGHALAVVVEVGRDAAQVVQVLLRPAPRLGELRLELAGPAVTDGLVGLGGRRALAWICGHARSPLSSTTSASTISSSPPVSAPFAEPSPPVVLCWACWACWYTTSPSLNEASRSASSRDRISPASSPSSACRTASIFARMSVLVSSSSRSSCSFRDFSVE